MFVAQWCDLQNIVIIFNSKRLKRYIPQILSLGKKQRILEKGLNIIFFYSQSKFTKFWTLKQYSFPLQPQSTRNSLKEAKYNQIFWGGQLEQTEPFRFAQP